MTHCVGWIIDGSQNLLEGSRLLLIGLWQIGRNVFSFCLPVVGELALDELGLQVQTWALGLGQIRVEDGLSCLLEALCYVHQSRVEVVVIELQARVASDL